MAGDEAGRFADVKPALLIPAINDFNTLPFQSQQFPRQLGLRPPAGRLIALSSEFDKMLVGAVGGAGALAVGLGLDFHLGRQPTQALLAYVKSEATEPVVASGNDEKALLAIDFYLVGFAVVHDSIVTGELKSCRVDKDEHCDGFEALKRRSGTSAKANPALRFFPTHLLYLEHGTDNSLHVEFARQDHHPRGQTEVGRVAPALP